MCFRPNAVTRNNNNNNNQITCQTCGMPVSEDSNTCPYCGDPIPSQENKDFEVDVPARIL